MDNAPGIDCERKDALIFRCKFEPRYDLSAAKLPGYGEVKTHDKSFLEAFRDKTYVRDVCVRCGRTIERDDRRVAR